MQLIDKQKYEIIIRRELHQSIRYIEKIMKISKTTVCLWCTRYQQNGNINRLVGSGRKRKTTTIQDNNIIKTLSTNKYITAHEIKKKLKYPICVRTIHNRLYENKFIYKNPKTKPLLTDAHKQKRLKWAIDNLKTNWKNVLFTDESSI